MYKEVRGNEERRWGVIYYVRRRWKMYEKVRGNEERGWGVIYYVGRRQRIYGSQGK